MPVAQVVLQAARASPLLEGRTLPLLVKPAAEIDAAAWAASHQDSIDTMLSRHAAVLFREFNLRSLQDFEGFASSIERELFGEYGDLPKKAGGSKTYESTPYPKDKMILFHNESSHLDRWPRKQFFFCEAPSLTGGATPIVDCREVLKRLPQDLVSRLQGKGLLYVRTFIKRLDVSWRDFYKTEDKSEVESRLRRTGIEWRWLDNDGLQTRARAHAIICHPMTGERAFFNQVQLHHPSSLDPDLREDLLMLVGEKQMPRNVYYGDGSKISDSDMAAIGRAYEECAVRFNWQQGDVLMLDNMLAAHARDPYEGPRKIVVAMGDMYERSSLSAHVESATRRSRL